MAVKDVLFSTLSLIFAKLSFKMSFKIKFKTLYAIVLCFSSLFMTAQVHLNNSSFEDKAQDATTPQGWIECEVGTTPDILPGFWGVKQLPKDGQTYIGLITRKDGSFESIGQRIHPPLQKGDCFNFSLYLAKSRKYVGYTKKIQLRIFVGTDRCDRDQVVYVSPKINHRDWKRYLVNFTAEQECNYMIIEAFTEEEGRTGHVLIDAISPINRCSKASL